jgi:hypothetical protein
MDKFPGALGGPLFRPLRGWRKDRRSRPFAVSRHGHDAAQQLPRTGHSGLPQHFWN